MRQRLRTWTTNVRHLRHCRPAAACSNLAPPVTWRQQVTQVAAGWHAREDSSLQLSDPAFAGEEDQSSWREAGPALAMFVVVSNEIA